jgi:D-aspartate ligase
MEQVSVQAAGQPSLPGRLQALKPIPAYVLGGYEAGLAVIRSLGAAGVPVIAVWSSELERARHSRNVKLSVRAPHPWHESEAYVELLLELGSRVGRGLLIPTTDEAVSAVGRAKEELETRHAVACPPWPVVERFLDKHLTYECARELGVPLPLTVLPGSAEELERLAANLPYPVVVKPRLGHLYRDAFGVKLTKASDRGELVSAWRRSERAGIGTVIQEFVPGSESEGANYNAYLVDGEPAVEVTARKVRLSPPDLGYPMVVVSGHVPEVIDPARRLLRGMGMSGFANVEFKRDTRDGTYKLMEVNGRPNMSGLLSIRCGIDFPLLTYRHVVLGDPPSPGRGGGREERVYWINDGPDVWAGIQGVRAGKSSLRNFLEPYLCPHVFASLSLADPGPFAALALAKLRSVARRGRPLRPRLARWFGQSSS